MQKDILSLKHDFIAKAKSLFQRGYATGSAGNMSMMLPNGNIIATPTGSSMGFLDVDSLSEIDTNGNLISGNKPTKEILFHLVLYKNNNYKAVVHLHSSYATAYSCLKNLNVNSVFKPITPYLVMKMGDIPLIPYYKPGSEQIAKDIEQFVFSHNAFLLANHGPICAGCDLNDAINNIEELEASARLYFILAQEREHISYLSHEQINQLRK